MIKPFEFEDSGRTYACNVEQPRAGRAEAWWWFGVSGDGHRYAPFQAVAGDTQQNVRSRIVAYYADLLERRAARATASHQWMRRDKPTTSATPAAPAGPPTESNKQA